MLIDGNYGGLTLFLWDGYRQDLGGETAGLLGGYGSLLTAQREGVLISATDAVLFGDVLGRFPHAVGMMYGGQFGINEPPAERGIVHVHIAAKGGIGFAQNEGSAGHALDATRDKGITHTCLNSLGRAIDGLQARAAKPVDGLPGNVQGETC